MPHLITNPEGVRAIFARRAEHADRLAAVLENSEMVDAWIRPG
jgi:hypothetical protein